MPLPPLPTNNTVRVWLAYTSQGVEHEMMFRLPSFATSVDAAARATDLAAILVTRMIFPDTCFSARYSPAGSNFSAPLPFTVIGGLLNVTPWAQDPESVQLGFTGRSFADGRDVAYQFFTAAPTPTWPDDNRYNPGEQAVIDTLRANFTTFVENGPSPARQVVTIGESIPTLNQYVNIRANAYWQNAQR